MWSAQMSRSEHFALGKINWFKNFYPSHENPDVTTHRWLALDVEEEIFLQIEYFQLQFWRYWYVICFSAKMYWFTSYKQLSI